MENYFCYNVNKFFQDLGIFNVIQVCGVYKFEDKSDVFVNKGKTKLSFIFSMFGDKEIVNIIFIYKIFVKGIFKLCINDVCFISCVIILQDVLL